jgi:hypothetical protein
MLATLALAFVALVAAVAGAAATNTASPSHRATIRACPTLGT